MTTAIEVKGLTKKFKNLTAVNGIDFEGDVLFTTMLYAKQNVPLVHDSTHRQIALNLKIGGGP